MYDLDQHDVKCKISGISEIASHLRIEKEQRIFSYCAPPSKPDLKLIRMNNFTAEVSNHIQGKRVTLETFNITVINILYQ